MASNPTGNEGIRRFEVPFLTLVRAADREWARSKRWQLEYQFSNGRQFFGDPSTRGAAADWSPVVDERGGLIYDEHGNTIVWRSPS